MASTLEAMPSNLLAVPSTQVAMVANQEGLQSGRVLQSCQGSS